MQSIKVRKNKPPDLEQQKRWLFVALWTPIDEPAHYIDVLALPLLKNTL